MARKHEKTTRKTGRNTEFGASKKVQGDTANSEALSENGVAATPRSSGRGIGSAFAQAVKTVLDESKDLKGSSRESFLGQEKVTLDPKQHAHSLLKKKQ